MMTPMLRRAVALAVILSLAWLTPGGAAYQAAAQVVGVSGAASSASSAAGAVGALTFSVPAASVSQTPSGPSSAVLSPSFEPSPSDVPLALPAGSAPSSPSALAPAASKGGALQWVVPKALRPSAFSATKTFVSNRVSGAAASRVLGAAASPSSFADAKTGEEAAALFDEAVFRPRALDAVVPSASADDPGENPKLAPSTTGDERPAAEVPAPRAKLPRSMWGLFWGHHIMTVFGVNFHILSQPFLVKDALGMGTATMGLVRNIHMGSMAVVNFLPVGYLIDKTDYRVVFIATSVARALLMAAIPLLFMSGGLHFTVLAAIVAVNPLFQSTMLVADGAARKSFLGKDEKLNKDAAATLGKWDSVAGAVMPVVAGWALGLLVSGLGLGGYAMGYGVYAALLLASIPIYLSMVRDPRFPENDRLSPAKLLTQGATFVGALAASAFHPFTLMLTWAVRSFFRYERPEFPAGKPLASLAWAGRELLVLLAGAALFVPAVLWSLRKVPAAVKAWRARRGAGEKRSLADVLERFKPTQGLAFILRNKTLRVLTSVMALEVLLIDALPFVVVPSLITDAVGAAPTSLLVPLWVAGAVAGAALAAVGAKAARLTASWRPALVLGGLAAAAALLHFFPGILLTQVATAGGIMGLLFSLEYVGRFLPSVRLEGEKGDAIIEKKGHGSFYRKAAVASLLFWALLIPAFVTTGMFWANIAIIGGVLFLVQYFNTPVGIVLEPVKRAQMDDDKLARIESAVFMVDLAFESVGALALGLTLDFFGLRTALIAVAVFLTLTGVLQYQVPRWIFPDGDRPAKVAPPTDPK